MHFLYLCEAHAKESWPLSPDAPNNHGSLNERVAAATSFLDKWPTLKGLASATYVDQMENDTTVCNGLWPERFVLLRHGVVSWASSLIEDSTADLPQKLSEAAQLSFA